VPPSPASVLVRNTIEIGTAIKIQHIPTHLPLSLLPSLLMSSKSLSLLTLSSTNSTTPLQFTHGGAELESVRKDAGLITHVWRDNLKEVFEKIVWMVDEYNYIAMVKKESRRRHV